MTYDAKELEQYPEIMNKEQLRKACHISKRTAHYLLQFNLIPHVCTGKKTRCYAIKKRDVIDFIVRINIFLFQIESNDLSIPASKSRTKERSADPCKRIKDFAVRFCEEFDNIFHKSWGFRRRMDFSSF